MYSWNRRLPWRVGIFLILLTVLFSGTAFAKTIYTNAGDSAVAEIAIAAGGGNGELANAVMGVFTNGVGWDDSQLGGYGADSIHQHYGGWECWAYANGVMDTLFGFTVYSNGNSSSSSKSSSATSALRGKSSVSYQDFLNAGIPQRAGTLLRVCHANNLGDGNDGGYTLVSGTKYWGHSVVILYYDSSRVVYIDGNGDADARVRLSSMSWSEFNSRPIFVPHAEGVRRVIKYAVYANSSCVNSRYPDVKYNLSVNAQKDGVAQSGLSGCGTVDVVINGTKVADDVSQYSASLSVGTSYQITDIKAGADYEYTGLYTGALSGKMGRGDQEVGLKFESIITTLIVKGVVDGTPVDSLEEYARFNYVIDGVDYIDAFSCQDVCSAGASYAVTDITGRTGYSYIGCSSNNESGTTHRGANTVVLEFVTDEYSGAEWTYADELPAEVNEEDYIIQYQNTYYKEQRNSPGTEWKNLGEIGSEYVDVGDSYSSYYIEPLSDTRVLLWSRYFHICGGTTGENISWKHTGPYVHWDGIDVNSVYVAGGPYNDDVDPNIKYYKLRWNNGSLAYCTSGVTCSGTSGSHGARSCYWFKEYCYQNRELVTTYRFSKTGLWQDTKDSSAAECRVRYKRKGGIVTGITLSDDVVILKPGQSLMVSVLGYDYEGADPEPEFVWEMENPDVATVIDGEITAVVEGVAWAHCGVTNQSEEMWTYCMVIVEGKNVMEMPKKLVNIEREAFTGIPATTIDFRNSRVSTIGTSAFSRCGKLRIVYMPDSITSISAAAFMNCNAEPIFICESDNAAAEYASSHEGIDWVIVGGDIF